MSNDYPALAQAISRLHAASYREVDGLSMMTKPIHSLEMMLDRHRGTFRDASTLQGYAFAKPRGYAGDFEIIERIYDTVVSDDPALKRWDEFFHVSPGADAVRNRPAFIGSILRDGTHESLLSLGCGGARDLAVTNGPGTLRRMTLVDTDPAALARARENLSNPEIDYTFLQKNVLRLKGLDPVDIVWSAGLFDYLNDKLATHLLATMRDLLTEGGEIVVGNFSKEHASRAYIEVICEWRLIHRTEEEMAALMVAAGFDPTRVRIESDETGVNLFARAVR